MKTNISFVILLLIGFIQTGLCQDQVNEEQQRIQRFKQEILTTYQSSGIGAYIPFEAFAKGYVQYFTRKELIKSNKPVISYLDYSKPNSVERFATINFMSRSVIIHSLAAHGQNSACHSQTCAYEWGVPAISFSNQNESEKSSLGFMTADERNYSGEVKQNLVLRGYDPTNLNVLIRGIKLHTVHNKKFSGISLGCIVLPPEQFWQAYYKLEGGTEVFTFEGNKYSSSDNYGSMEELKKASEVREKTGFANVPEVPAEPLGPNWNQGRLGRAAPSLGSIAYSKSGDFSRKAMLGDDQSKLPKLSIPNEVAGVVLLKGSRKFQECQLLSDASWKITVNSMNDIDSGIDHFTGSWLEFDKYVAENGLPDGKAEELMQIRMRALNDCMAIASISHRTDFDKSNINDPETKSSKDGKITCVYNGPESQDYRNCLVAIEAHESLLKAEATAQSNQRTNYQNRNNQRVDRIRSQSESTTAPPNNPRNREQQSSQSPSQNRNAVATQTSSLSMPQATPSMESYGVQTQAMIEANGMIEDHATIATERADISNAKILALAAVASKIPTLDSLYDECNSKLSKKGTLGLDNFNQVAAIYAGNEGRKQDFNQAHDYCLAAVSSQVNPIHNQNAREQIRNVLRDFGHEMQEYKSRARDLLQQSSIMNGMNNGQWGGNFGGGFGGKGVADDDINFNGNLKNDVSGYSYKNFDGQGTSLLRSNELETTGSASLNLNSGKNKNEKVSVGNRIGLKQGFGGSDFKIDSNENRPVNISDDAYGAGIYNEDFYRKINLALQNPSQLEALHLSADQMKEYLNQKNYFDSMDNANSIGKNQLKNSRSARSKSEVLEFREDLPVSPKELNLFEIISLRYSKKFAK